jgi:osmoprotectant transport system permease protein
MRFRWARLQAVHGGAVRAAHGPWPLRWWAGAAFALALLQQPCSAAEPLRVGSKRFTESTILGEILVQTAARTGPAEHIPGMGNTAIVFAALRNGSIDLYPEYLGTIELEILHHEKAGATVAQIDTELAPLGLGVAIPLGFSNSYGIGMRGEQARTLGVQRISDLAGQAQLRAGLSHEFLGRADGWPGLAARYGLPQRAAGLDHGLAFEALAQGRVDLIDVYTTDAKIARFDIKVLADDRGYFPRYDAVVLYRRSVAQQLPQTWQALESLRGRISTAQMIALNGEAENGHRPAADIARDFLAARAGAPHAASFLDRLLGPDLLPLTLQHLGLVASAVVLATLLGIPLGVAAVRRPVAGPLILGAVSVLQTIPALALLAALIPLLGAIGTAPTLVALFLFALLPIVRNTAVGLGGVPQALCEAATALGARPAARLWLIELPLAAPLIVAGIRTAAVISVGTATIGAFVGAGGYGQRISIGLALNDDRMLLAGALPAAVLALALEGCFAGLERRMRR